MSPFTRFDVDASPEWLFFRIEPSTDSADATSTLAERLWRESERRLIYRQVIELAEHVMLSSELVGQLVLLHKRTHVANGLTRLCGLNQMHYEVLRVARLTDRFPNYANREAAVMGRLPS
jgi:hypothetical protein